MQIMANGEGCMCAARYVGECACDNVDWNPPKKEFIGLTDDELEVYAWIHPKIKDIAKQIEQALKEKNNG